jgi:hypothetical protein
MAYILSARDDAAKMFKQLNDVAEQSGKSVKDAFDEAAAASDRAGKATSKLTDFIKEQRAENRQQNFLLRESVGAFSAVATALTIFSNTASGGTAQVKMLSDSVNAGVTAFQGFDFALSALGMSGPLGVAIAAIGAAAIAIKVFQKSSSDSNDELDKSALALAKVKYELGELARAELEEAYAAVRAGLMKRLMDLKEKTPDVIGTVITRFKEGFSSLEGFLRMVIFGATAVSGHPGGIIYKMIGTPKEINDIMTAIAGLDLELKKIWDTAVKEIPKDRGPLVMIDLLGQKFKEAGDKWQKSVAKIEGVTVGMSETMRDVLRTIEQEWTEKAQTVQTLWGGVAGAIGEGFSAAFEGTEGGARAFLRRIFTMLIDLVQGWILAAAAAAIVKGIFTFGTTLAGDLVILGAATVALQAARAALNTKFHQGGTVPGGMFINAAPEKEFPILVRGGETVRTEQQEAALQGGGQGVHLHFHNSYFASARAFKEVVQRGMRELGVRDVANYFRDPSHDIAIVVP